MKKAIATTTIHSVTPGIIKMAEIAKRDSWKMFIAGDLKTPHEEYHRLEEENDSVIYLSPEYQMDKYPELSEAIGFSCIQRRNFAMIEAYKYGAEIIALWDDDNIPLKNWGKEIRVNEKSYGPLYMCEAEVFDPLSVCVFENHLWHRGYPIQLLKDKKKVVHADDHEETRVLVQADLWNGNPDIDAICRISYNPESNFDVAPHFFSSDKISPFNSQNTFLSRKLFPTYFLFPGIGRMDDIWAGYIAQYYFPNSVIYGPATVYQKRNEHNLVKDLEDEMIGYKYTYELIKDLEHWQRFMPEKSLKAYELYKKEFV